MNGLPTTGRRVALVIVLLILVASRVWPGHGTAAPANPATPSAAPLAPAPTVGPAPVHSDIGFSTRAHLEEHFHKHGAEFHAASAADYLRLAQALRDRAAGGDVLEAVRADGTITRFDRESRAFLAFDRDGVIHTFFRPNDGEAYFRRQLNREPNHS